MATSVSTRVSGITSPEGTSLSSSSCSSSSSSTSASSSVGTLGSITAFLIKENEDHLLISKQVEVFVEKFLPKYKQDQEEQSQRLNTLSLRILQIGGELPSKEEMEKEVNQNRAERDKYRELDQDFQTFMYTLNQKITRLNYDPSILRGDRELEKEWQSRREKAQKTYQSAMALHQQIKETNTKIQAQFAVLKKINTSHYGPSVMQQAYNGVTYVASGLFGLFSSPPPVKSPPSRSDSSPSRSESPPSRSESPPSRSESPLSRSDSSTASTDTGSTTQTGIAPTTTIITTTTSQPGTPTKPLPVKLLKPLALSSSDDLLWNNSGKLNFGGTGGGGIGSSVQRRPSTLSLGSDLSHQGVTT